MKQETIQTFFENGKFRLFISRTDTFTELLKFFTGEYTWDTWCNRHREEIRLFEKAFRLVTSTSEAAELYRHNQNDDPRDERLFEKMLDLASSHADLDTIYYHLAIQEYELRRRNFIRRVFDKADQLGYPTGEAI